MQKDYVIIVAGGKGTRMGGAVPKQFLPVGGIPVLMRTISVFHETDSDLQIIVVIPEEQHVMWEELCKTYAFTIPYRLAKGGRTRFESVKNGLALVDSEDRGVVCVHDGVRPFVSPEVIRAAIGEARHGKAVVPAIPVVDSLRLCVDGQPTRSVNRSNYFMVQTPQTFPVNMLKRAYRQPYEETFTDDASVVERAGDVVTVIEGNRENIKLTAPMDMLIAESLLGREQV